MALPEIFPTKIDVGGSLLGRKFTEDKWEEVFGALHVPFVVTGLGQSSLSGLDWTIEAGTAVIGGFRVKTASQLITLPASSTVNLWLELTKDGNGDINDAQFTAKTDATVPAGFPLAMVVRQFITGASSVTRQHDRRSLRGDVYHTRYRGGDANAGTLMLGFTPRCVEIFGSITAGTDVRYKKITYFDGAADGILSVLDTGANIVNLSVGTGAAIVAGGVKVGTPVDMNDTGIDFYLTAW
jgi:hypothetical protein